MAWLIHAVVPLWLALPVPLIAALRCTQQFFFFHRIRNVRLTPSEIDTLVAALARRAVVTVCIVSAWGAAVSLMAPRELAYFIFAIAGFTAFGAVTYAIYIPTSMRLILALVGASILVVSARNFDLFGFVIFLIYAGNALLVQRTLTTHVDNVRAAVRKEIESQLRYHESLRVQAEIAKIANTDELTGIANRRAFLSFVRQLVNERSEDRRPFALGVIDLDGFKPVNDCYGHAAGDAVLIEVARRLQLQIGKEGIVARIGGDEFAVVFLESKSEEELRATAQSLILAVSAPIELPQNTARVSGSCGFALFPAAGIEPATLLERADEALYSIKADQHTSFAIYDCRNEASVMRRAILRQRLPIAIEAGLIRLHYQPIVDAEGRLQTFEALARWHDERLGLVSPDEFIQLAEKSGLIGELTRRLFRDAVQEAATWPHNVRLAFNFSAVLFADTTIGLDILKMLSDRGLLPSRIVLEITETALLKRPDEACVILEALRATGIAIAIDDFGTGYSSFGQLHRLPIDILKIDQMFFSDLGEGSKLRDIASAITSIGQRLDLQMVAEGIETNGQRDFAIAAGCQSLQGHLIGAPMPPDRLPEFWSDRDQLHGRSNAA